MNDDQLTQPQDAADAQDSSNGDEGTHGMNDTEGTGSTDVTGDTANMGDTSSASDTDVTTDTQASDTQAQSTDTTDSSPSTGADDVDSLSTESTSDVAGSSLDSEDSGADTQDTAAEDTSSADDVSGAPTATDEDTSAAPQAARNERSEERQPRPQRPQYESDEDTSDEMVIHTARDPRLDEIASNASMEDLMKASERQYRQIKHGDVIEGTVMKVSREEIMIDIGGKTEGVISSRESTTLTEAERDALQVGDPLLVSVVQPHNSEGQAVLSLDRARQEKAWRDLQRSFEAGETISAPVVGHNKGGILVNIEGIRGFVPSSQVSSLPPGEANKQAEMARLHNQSIPLKIIEINRHRNRLILSERQAMQEQRESMRAKLLLELEPGQIRPGTVTSVCDFGAFVDIGGADGLIHLSELSWKRVSHPSEVLKVGDRINVYVLSVDQNERKIALSLKRTQPEPWETITDQYQLGQMVRGTITQITTFGAFARLEDGIEGLIHVSELAEGRVAHPRNVVKEGEVLDLKVIRIDPARKRIGLSLKRVNEDANRDAEGASEGSEDGMSDTDAGSQDRSGMDTDGNAPLMQAQGGDGAQSEQPRQEQQPRPEQPRPEPRQPRQQSQGQQRQGNQGQRPQRGQQPQQPLTSQSDDFEPLGALAAALQAHTQRAENDETEQIDEPTIQQEQSDPGEVIGALSGINTSADMDAISSMGGDVSFDTTDSAASDEDSDSGDGGTSNTADIHGDTDDTGEASDTADTTATTPEMGAFGSDNTDSTTGLTDVATDSGDMPTEDTQGRGDEPQAGMSSSSDPAGDTGDNSKNSITPDSTDAASDSDDTVSDATEASMPSSESMNSGDDTLSGSDDKSASLADISSDDVNAEAAASADTSTSNSTTDDLESSASSGSEGAPSTVDSEGDDTENQG